MRTPEELVTEAYQRCRPQPIALTALIRERDLEHEQSAQQRIAEARAAAFRLAAAIARRDDDAKQGWGESIAIDIEEAAKQGDRT